MTKQTPPYDKLARYVSRVMERKGLDTHDVERRSKRYGKGISQSYVSIIKNGTRKALSVEILKALAHGLGEPVLDLLAIAAGEDASAAMNERERRIRALFHGVDKLDAETQREIDAAMRVMERAVESYKSEGGTSS